MKHYVLILRIPEISENTGGKEGLIMNKRFNSPIGIIAEDMCDVESVKELIYLIIGNRKKGEKHFVGKGCGKISRKCNAWAKQLNLKGCEVLIIIHDLDKNNKVKLFLKLNEALSPCP